MKHGRNAIAAIVLSFALVLTVGVTAANASRATGYKACAPKYFQLGSNTDAGYIYHKHVNSQGQTYIKDWPNSAAGWRYSTGGYLYQNVNWEILTSTTPTNSNIYAYSTLCKSVPGD